MPRLLWTLQEKYKDSFAPDHLTALDRKLTEVKAYNDKNLALPPVMGSVPAYIATRLLFLQSEVQYLEIYRKALKDLYDDGLLSFDEYGAERDKFMDVEAPRRHEALALRTEPRVVAQGLREKILNEVPIYEAYLETMRDRMNAASGNFTRMGYIRDNFKKGVLNYHNADGEMIPDRGGQVWCNAFGWQPGGIVEVAHIVPKSLDGEQLSHIFGAKVNLLRDFENTFFRDLVIMPVKEQDAAWECVVVNESLKTEKTMGHFIWNDIHHKPLQFNCLNRPAKRYLYFRFFMTYLKQKWLGNTPFTKAVETKHLVWPDPTRYLRESFVRVVGQHVFGEDMSNLFHGTFQDGKEEKNSDKIQYANERAAVWLMEVVRTLKE